MATAINFEHVSKRFALRRAQSRSFQEMVANLFRRFRKGNHHATGQKAFWVLKDVSFSLEQGKTIGLIGVNGAGKSTALKLMSGIIEPTSGTVNINGRVGALLELGAGFHPDLTGRENIYLNASILGLARAEVRRKFDDIVAFSELEPFIDVPVKHYSSGMYVRLGFAVAVHTDPEILLIDEVLSVGDASFQRKCMDRIAELRRSGVTIVLVSHGLGTIQTFCDEAIWFDEGAIQAQGHAVDVVMAYMSQVARRDNVKSLEVQDRAGQPNPLAGQRWGTGRIELTRVALCDQTGTSRAVFETGEPMDIQLHYHAAERIEAPVFGFSIHHQNGAHVCGPNTLLDEVLIPVVEGEGVITYHIPALTLLEGTYQLSVAAVNETSTEFYDYHDRLYPFRVYRGECRELYGLVTLNGEWHRATSQSDLIEDNDAH